MNVIAVVNHKGGVAKTTTTVNLAGALVERGRKVLIVDLDPQASASLWLGVRSKGDGLLEAVLTGSGLADHVGETESTIDLVPAGPAFASLEKLAAEKRGAETLLRRALKGLPERWDYVFLDCPPSLNLTSVSAIVAATHALVPVVAQVLSLDPLARLLDTMWQVRGRSNRDLQLNGMFATRVDVRTAHAQEVMKMLRDQFGDMVYRVFVRENVQLAEAAGFQQPVTQYAPDSNGAVDYRELAKEFERRVKKTSAWQKEKAKEAEKA